jgi:phosphoenolpyruvate carboxykinase (ATP)
MGRARRRILCGQLVASRDDVRGSMVRLTGLSGGPGLSPTIGPAASLSCCAEFCGYLGLTIAEKAQEVWVRSLDDIGFHNTGSVHWNLAAPRLYEEAILRGEGNLADGGALVVLTGVHTGRSAKDKFIVREPENEANIWWGAVNKDIDIGHYTTLRQRMLAYLQGRDLFVQDCWAGADSRYRLGVRVITEAAWHSLFAQNMFIAPTADELASFVPGFTIIQAPGFEADPAIDGTRSDTFIVVNFADKTVLIGGTSYAGEIKKSVFSILNYMLPENRVLPMHCSVNVGAQGDSAVFFGLSGTGKTTLSADPNRRLVGDDEHGWSDNGLFNFEGGCYAKVIRLSAEAEPEIFATTSRFGAVLENVVVDEATRALDLHSAQHTENTRASYPIDFIPNIIDAGVAGHPRNVIMLTADAFGVLPPISRLTTQQAMYHFLSGYTAKVAGTEKGLGNEPEATFSTCFGAPFMPRHPSVYASLLGEKIVSQNVTCWLVNTGWTGGAYGVGKRISIKYTRALLNAALHGGLDAVTFELDPHFGLSVPQACEGVPSDVLNPRDTWPDKSNYEKTAANLVGRFAQNFVQFEQYVEDDVRAAAPRATA